MKGPLNCFNSETESWELCGIVSWGAECADPGRKKILFFTKVFNFCEHPELPGVYTRVTKFLPWIKKNV